ncbi:hypothetical protein [uncultured Thiodictyon sp.]|uniref:hypothetical protein n=1 Tax=uncultured Thiodictyon sp. TaxID=1846217 RepID=UPI0025E00CD6|nr:hypothetical protein [uncultured Thiodictyon sp.]
MNPADIRTIMRACPVSTRHDRTGRLREVCGVAYKIAEWQPIFRANRAAISVHIALFHAGFLAYVDELCANGPAGVSVRLAADVDPETEEQVLFLIDQAVWSVRLAMAREPTLH